MSRRPDLQVPVPRLPPDQSEKVLAELERVLANPLFRSSRRCHNLLRRITEQSIAGNIDSLKERALGVDVFARHPDYDSGGDPIVRASAAETRKKLAQYYQEAGPDTEVRIELPSGSYLAEFHFAAGTSPRTTPKLPPRMRWTLALGILAVAGLLLGASLWAPPWRPSDLDELWNPILKAPGAVLVSVRTQVAYNWRSALAQDEAQGIVAPGPESALGRLIREDDLVLVKDRYVALDDTICMARITALLERYRKPFRIRGEMSTSFADLRDTPAVLIGAFDNPWTRRTADQLRFTLRKDSRNGTGMVVDRQHPENTGWSLYNYWPNWDIPIDYAIVTRMLDPTSDRPVVIAAGLTQYGTMGAGEFLTNSEYFSEAARRLPRGWPGRNLQFVLGVPVVNRISGRPRVLATDVW